MTFSQLNKLVNKKCHLRYSAILVKEGSSYTSINAESLPDILRNRNQGRPIVLYIGQAVKGKE